MKNKIWIPASLATMICIILLFWQGKVSLLKSKVVRERQTVAALEKTEMESHPKFESIAKLEDDSRSGGADLLLHSDTVSKLLNSIPDGIPRDDNVSLIRAFPNALSLLEDFTVDELFVFLGDLSEVSDHDSKAFSTLIVLLTLVSQVEAERVLTFLEPKGMSGGLKFVVEPSALANLARQDPAKAEAFLKNANWMESLNEYGQMAVLSGWAQTDFNEAIRYLKELKTHSGREILALANAGQNSEVRAQMQKAVEEMDDSLVKRKISLGLIKAEYVAEGFEGVSQLLSEMTFSTPEARDEAVFEVTNTGLVDQPRETIEWIQKEASLTQKAEYLASNIGSWARLDYQAAGEWLTSQEPSSDTDYAISAYASTVVQIDPAAAMTWVNEIQDKNVQQKARQRSLRKWHGTDPVAARNWVDEQGLEAEKWLPNSE